MITNDLMSEYDLLKYFITIRNGCNKLWAAHNKFISNYKKFWLAYYHDLINSLPEYNVKIQFPSSFHRRENSLTGKDILNAVMLQISIRSDNRNLKSETNWRKKKYDGMLFWKKLHRKKVTIRILQRMKYWGCYSDILFPILEVIITSILKPI